MAELFNKKILEQRVKKYSIDNIDKKLEKIRSWQENLQNIKGLNEKRLQSAFLKAIYEDILGYKNAPQQEEWTLEIECSTDIDAKTPDGIIGFYKRENGEEIKDHRAVIELKGPQVSLDKDQKREGTTYKSPVDQAFSYTNKLDGCKWVIVSNFVETRLYKVGRSKEYYEVFLLDDLGDIDNFKRFHYLLHKDNLINKSGKSLTMELSEATHKRQEDISVEFYNIYKDLRINLFEHLKETNEDLNAEILLEKAQKFLDRIIFICFCEDKGLLPNDLLHEAIQRGKETFSVSDNPIWDQIKGVFRAIDEGSTTHNINAYNGGLFEYDEVLDELVIEDEFFETIYDISDYDFDSDLDVNILGHIFEQSIADIEKIKSDINEDEFDEKESKRKKDGIYYTPKYITSYIVENAVGGYLEDIKEELGYNELPDIAEANSKSWESRYTKQHLEFYDKYEERLKEIKILDPACGSGAFLNQAFDYLLEEHQWLNKQRDLLKDRYMSIDSLEAIQKDILKNNLFGVDLNEESVEITKLSLWLKTANKKKPLTNLDNNIKCGNSLIDDPEIASNKAFNWDEEFENIMEQGGFDVVIGNPPYVRAERISWMNDYLQQTFDTYNKTADLYVYFIEKSLHLLKRKGYFSFIVSNQFTRANYGKKIRQFLSKYKIEKYTDYTGQNVFKNVSVNPCVIVVQKNQANENNIIDFNDKYEVYQESLKGKFWSFLPRKSYQVKEKIENRSIPLNDWEIEINYGIKTGYNQAFIIDKETKNDLISKEPKSEEIIKPLLKGRHIKRYKVDFKDIYLLATGYDMNIPKEYPAIYHYLKQFKNKAKKRYDQGENWWNLRACSYYHLFEKNKIIYPETTNSSNVFVFDDDGFYIDKTAFMMYAETDELLIYLTVILNSKLMKFYMNTSTREVGEGFQLSKMFVENFPVIKTDYKNTSLTTKGYTLIKSYKRLKMMKDLSFNNLGKRFLSNIKSKLNKVINNSDFKNEIYSGGASKVRQFTVNINTNIVTLYSEKSGSGKYELLKYEENNEYKRRFIKYYLENLTEEQLEEINDKYDGNLLDKVLQIEIPDYDKDHVVKKVVEEWESLQEEIKDLEEEIEQTDNEIDQMVYDLYDLTDEEIKIVEESLED